MLAIYRRHNPKKCSSTDTQNCSNKRRPCPIWVRGSRADGHYVREPMKSRDWTRALDVMRLGGHPRLPYLNMRGTSRSPAWTRDKSHSSLPSWKSGCGSEAVFFEFISVRGNKMTFASIDEEFTGPL